MYTVDILHSLIQWPTWQPPRRTIPPWILSCIHNITRCECLTKLRSDNDYIQGAAYEKKKSTTTPVLTIQIIEFTFTHDRFLDQAIQIKEDKYNPLVGAIRAHGWNSRLRTVITVGLRGALHKRSIEHLKNLHIQTSFFFENSMTYIYQIAIKHLTYLVVNKNKYPPPNLPHSK